MGSPKRHRTRTCSHSCQAGVLQAGGICAGACALRPWVSGCSGPQAARYQRSTKGGQCMFPGERWQRSCMGRECISRHMPGALNLAGAQPVRQGCGSLPCCHADGAQHLPFPPARSPQQDLLGRLALKRILLLVLLLDRAAERQDLEPGMPLLFQIDAPHKSSASVSGVGSWGCSRQGPGTLRGGRVETGRGLILVRCMSSRLHEGRPACAARPVDHELSP